MSKRRFCEVVVEPRLADEEEGVVEESGARFIALTPGEVRAEQVHEASSVVGGGAPVSGRKGRALFHFLGVVLAVDAPQVVTVRARGVVDMQKVHIGDGSPAKVDVALWDRMVPTTLRAGDAVLLKSVSVMQSAAFGSQIRSLRPECLFVLARGCDRLQAPPPWLPPSHSLHTVVERLLTRWPAVARAACAVKPSPRRVKVVRKVPYTDKEFLEAPTGATLALKCCIIGGVKPVSKAGVVSGATLKVHPVDAPDLQVAITIHGQLFNGKHCDLERAARDRRTVVLKGLTLDRVDDVVSLRTTRSTLFVNKPREYPMGGPHTSPKRAELPCGCPPPDAAGAPVFASLLDMTAASGHGRVRCRVVDISGDVGLAKQCPQCGKLFGGAAVACSNPAHTRALLPKISPFTVTLEDAAQHRVDSVAVCSQAVQDVVGGDPTEPGLMERVPHALVSLVAPCTVHSVGTLVKHAVRKTYILHRFNVFPTL